MKIAPRERQTSRSIRATRSLSRCRRSDQTAPRKKATLLCAPSSEPTSIALQGSAPSSSPPQAAPGLREGGIAESQKLKHCKYRASASVSSW